MILSDLAKYLMTRSARGLSAVAELLVTISRALFSYAIMLMRDKNALTCEYFLILHGS